MLAKQQRTTEALDLYERLLCEHHNNVLLLTEAGQTYTRILNSRRAIELQERAAALAGKNAYVLAELGATYQIAGFADKAMACYQKAAELAPDNPSIRCGLAEVYERTHQVELAREQVQAAIKLDPNAQFPCLYLAMLNRRCGEEDQAREQLAKLIQDLSLPAHLRWRAHYELASMADREGDVVRAWELWSAGKAIQSHLADDAKEQSELSRQEAETICLGLQADMVSRWVRQPPADQGRHAFLLGHPRSGTTLMERVLDAHPDVLAADERPLASGVHGGVKSACPPDTSFHDMLDSLKEQELARLRSQYRTEAEGMLAQPLKGRLLMDKSPDNFPFVPTLIRVFPDARYVVMLRDPRDVLLSCFMQPFPVNSFSMHFQDIVSGAKRYVWYMSLWLHFRDLLPPSSYLEVRYEEMVDDFETHARKLITLLNLDWRDDVLAFHQASSERLVRTPSYQAVTAPVNRKAVGRWQRYRDQLAPALPVLAPVIKALGYELEP